MKRIIIAGAGDLGREVFSWMSTVPNTSKDWEFCGFIDDNPDALAKHANTGKVISSIQKFEPSPEDWIVPAIADPAAKLEAMRALEARKANFFAFVHPTCVMGLNVRIGKGCVFMPHTAISCNAQIGDFVTANISATIGHDTIIGDGAILSCHADVMGHVRLGRGVFLGSHASVLPRLEVGDFSVVGAGSVVMRKVPAHVTVAGLPAKRITGFESESVGRTE